MTATWPTCFWGPHCADLASSPEAPLYQKAHADDFGVPEAEGEFVEDLFRVGSDVASVTAEFVIASARTESVVTLVGVLESPTVFVACGSSDTSGAVSETWFSFVLGT